MSYEDKSDKLKNYIDEVMGFNVELKIKLEHCPVCMEEINRDDFRDQLSLREFDISGMCQSCQDITFVEDEDE